jgi:hypothetical protein
LYAGFIIFARPSGGLQLGIEVLLHHQPKSHDALFAGKVASCVTLEVLFETHPPQLYVCTCLFDAEQFGVHDENVISLLNFA